MEKGERESLFERQHSFKWYFDELCKEYDSLVENQEKAVFDAINSLKTYFTSKNENRNLDQLRNKTGISLFVHKPADEVSDQGEKHVRVYEHQKILIYKRYDTVDSLLQKICENNVDRTIFSADDKIVNLKNTLYWLYVDTAKSDTDVQMTNRISEFYRAMFRQLKIRCIDLNSATLPPSGLEEKIKVLDKISDATVNGYVESALDGKNQQSVTGFVNTVKLELKKLIDDIFNIYKKLQGFLKYAVPHNMTNVEGMTRQNFNKVVALAKAIEDVIVNVFLSYLKIDCLKLPRSEFACAQLAHSNCSNSSFINSDFRNASFVCAYMRDCDLSMCDMSDCDATSADLTGCTLSYAKLEGANFSDAILNNANLDSVGTFDVSPTEIFEILNKYGSKEDNYRYAEDDEENEHSSKDNNDIEDKDFFTAFSKKPKSVEIYGDRFRDSIVNNLGKDSGLGTAKAKRIALDTIAKEDDMSVSLKSSMCNVLKAVSADKNTDNFIAANRIMSANEKVVKAVKKSRYEQLNVNAPGFVNFQDASVKNAFLPRIDLCLANVSGASFNDSDISDAAMAYTKSMNADFSKANISKLNAYKSNLNGASFAAANGIGNVFLDCNLNNATFSRALMLNSVFINSDRLTSAYIDEIINAPENDVYGVDALVDNVGGIPYNAKKDYDMQNSTWDNANANNAFFYGMQIVKSRFYEADFKGSMFLNCEAGLTTWDNADLTFSAALGVSYANSSFVNTNMSQSRLYACVFSLCNMSNAKLVSSRMDKVLFLDTSLGNVSMANAYFSNCVFKNSSFSNAILSRACFEKCVFVGIDFGTCVGSHSVTFKDCVIEKCSYDRIPCEREDDSDQIKIGNNLKLQVSSDKCNALTRYSSN